MLWFLAAVAGGGDIDAQSAGAEVIDDTTSVRCADCVVTLQATVIIGKSSDAERPGHLSWLKRDLLGGYLALSDDGSAVLRYDTNGEFRGVVRHPATGLARPAKVGWVLPLSGDSLEVRFAGDGATYVFGPTSRLERTYVAVLEGREELVLTPSTRRVVAGTGRAPRNQGQPLHVIGTSQSVQASFGADGNQVSETCVRDCAERILSGGTGSEAFWAAWKTKYRIEEWNGDGQLLRVLERRAWWFEDRDHDTPFAEVLRDGDDVNYGSGNYTVAHLAKLIVDEHNHAFVLAFAGQAPRGSTTHLEVLSVDGGLLASMPMPPNVFLLDERTAYTRHTSDGYSIFTVFRVAIDGTEWQHR